jgi:aspartyl-tRNA(Asn)/glutamyl-tRNA(Gln) amidotransferase subunit C
MKKTHTIDQNQVKQIAKLANVPLETHEAESFAQAFVETLDVVSQLQSVDTAGVEPTHQVTGLENILREDKVDEARMFTQAQALANASQMYDGYFVIPRVIDEE